MRVYTQTNYICNYLNRFTLEMCECRCANEYKRKRAQLVGLSCMCTHCFINHHQTIFHFTMWGKMQFHRFKLPQIQQQLAIERWITHTKHFVYCLIVCSQWKYKQCSASMTMMTTQICVWTATTTLLRMADYRSRGGVHEVASQVKLSLNFSFQKLQFLFCWLCFFSSFITIPFRLVSLFL